MLSIPCPYCGPRDEIEFVCGGENRIVRPEPPQSVTDTQWADYLFFRRNERGLAGERWMHRYGCGQWFNVARNTLTHVIETSYRMGEREPERK